MLTRQSRYHLFPLAKHAYFPFLLLISLAGDLALLSALTQLQKTAGLHDLAAFTHRCQLVFANCTALIGLLLVAIPVSSQPFVVNRVSGLAVVNTVGGDSTAVARYNNLASYTMVACSSTPSITSIMDNLLTSNAELFTFNRFPWLDRRPPGSDPYNLCLTSSDGLGM